jgi:exonuclease III
VFMNVNGWTNANSELRQKMLSASDADIICVSETHLSGDSQINIPGYLWCGFNRPLKHARAAITHGGVGMFMKNSFLNTFSYEVIDRSFDGILGLKFKHIESDAEMIVYSIYLPPETGIWGRDAPSFFNHILSACYLYSDVDYFVIGGILMLESEKMMTR